MSDHNHIVEIVRGESPLILAMPHTGLFVPEDVERQLNQRGKKLEDTDWHIDRLYSSLMPQATIVRALFHRYVIDANRDPSGTSLYPGQNTTQLCPLTDFNGQLIYCDGSEPDADEIVRRTIKFHTPYHAALQSEIDRVVGKFGIAMVYDCHSIRSQIPFLFEGGLPDFNIGTNEGATCAQEVEQMVGEICAGARGYSSIINGRFKGGWTTRHYGKPQKGVHAIQMELAQSTYLQSEQPPFDFARQPAEKLRIHLKKILGALTTWALEHSTKGPD